MMILSAKCLRKRCLTAFYILLILFLLPLSVQAAHEIDLGTVSTNVLTGQAVQWTDDVSVQWTVPDTGNDVLQEFFYKWNTSETALDFSGFTQKVLDIENPIVVEPEATFAGDDGATWRYLHIMTFYLDVGTSQPTYSSDVVIGPFMIDNFAPTGGTVRIVDLSGIDITTTSSTQLNLNLSAGGSPTKMYLSESETRPGTSFSYSASAVWNLQNTEAGSKTINAWFEDSAGNITTTPATDSVTLLSSTSINPNTAEIDLAAGGTQVFRVEGTTADYTWAVINQVPETLLQTVAQISGSDTGNTVTVQALNKGTFQMQATPAVGDPLTSDTITVIMSVKPGDVNNDGDVTLDDVKLVFGIFLGAQCTPQQCTAANVCPSENGLNDVKGVFTIFLGGTPQPDC